MPMETESRLARLERSNRRLTAAVVVLTSVVVVGVCGGAMPYPKHIYVSGITITASNGNNIGHFGTNRDGDGRIMMYDRNGNPRIIVAARSDFGAVHFVDNNAELVGSIFGNDVTEDIEPTERFKVGK